MNEINRYKDNNFKIKRSWLIYIPLKKEGKYWYLSLANVS